MSKQGEVATITNLRTLIYCEIQRDYLAVFGENHHCVKSFGEDLKVTDVFLCEKVPHFMLKPSVIHYQPKQLRQKCHRAFPFGFVPIYQLNTLIDICLETETVLISSYRILQPINKGAGVDYV